MKNFVLFPALLWTGVALAAPKTPQKMPPQKVKPGMVSVAQVRHTIEQNEKRYGQAMKEGDATTYMSLFAPDARVLRGNMVITGRDKLGAAFKKGPKFKDVVFAIQAVDVSGDLAYEVGSYKVTLASGKVNTGNYVEIWKHQPDNTWKIQVEATVPHQ
ncbi:hypothetical protein IAD21_01338 [Abditibacteriota bacterium]|nr:hypothetical protein IAD21_01338 [Abditibacteriota bacterium]